MDQALADVLRLSRAMTSKNAVAGLDHGGGKAVVLGDPHRDKTPELLRAYGRFVESLGGRYVTACDVGTYVADMDVVGEETRWATGRSPGRGGAGDSSVLTAYGVFQGMRAAAQHLWGEASLAGRRVGIAGVGKVGHRLVEHLLEDGADVVVADVDPDAVRAVLERPPRGAGGRRRGGPRPCEELDVFSPNALGGALDEDTVEVLRARVVCGGANNQLVTSRGPAGPPTACASAASSTRRTSSSMRAVSSRSRDELHGFDMERARRRTETIFEHTLEVLRTADEDDVSPAVAADRVAERRIAAGGRRPWLPGDPVGAREPPDAACGPAGREHAWNGSPLTGTASPERLL